MPMIVESRNTLSNAIIMAMNISWVSSEAIDSCWDVNSDGAKLLSNTLHYCASYLPGSQKFKQALLFKLQSFAYTNVTFEYK